MTPDDQNAAMAELEGWKRSPDGSFHPCTPDYLTDLNAVARVEEKMDHELASEWMDALSRVIHGHAGHRTFNMIRATALEPLEMDRFRLWLDSHGRY